MKCVRSTPHFLILVLAGKATIITSQREGGLRTQMDIESEVESFSMLSHVPLFAAPWRVAHQDLLSMEFSRQEYWSGLPFPSLGDLPK